MDYKNFLASKPFMNEYPRQVVIIKNSDGSERILHVNNQRLSGVGPEGYNEQLVKAINEYFKSNGEAKSAEIFTLKSTDEKKFVGTIQND